MNNSTLQNRRRKILAIEDNMLNREILGEILKKEYDVIYAENGAEGIELLRHHRTELSMVLLDVYMPVCDGFEFLKITQADPYLSSVPVLVTTGSENYEDEEKCIRLGAMDFINKPYQPETLLGRVHNIIRYRESISTLSVVEYDDLTGLYTMSAFYHHAEQLLKASDEEWDIKDVSIRDFSVLSNIYGEKKSDELLKFVADDLNRYMEGEGLIARHESCFYILEKTTGGEDIKNALLQPMEISEKNSLSNIRISVGIYQHIDKSQPIPVLCERAKMGMKSAKSEGTVSIGYYSQEIETRRVQEQKIIMAFEPALANHEFTAWYQPKVEIASGEIVAAEALVRWIDTEGHIVSPGAFIPILEQENMIDKLDEYVFREVCKFQKNQKKNGKKLIPISVNLSRNSLYRDDIIERYQKIAEEEEIDLTLIPIEITESAVVVDLRVQEVCNKFVDAGFTLQMDDFGNGYSALSSLASLPFSVLKMDKSLIDRLETEKGAVIVKSVIEIAQTLEMKVVAEGVESREQGLILAQMECDLIQGYYYSAPMKVDDFVDLLDKTSPYPTKRIYSIEDNAFLKMNKAELRRYLRACRILFPCVRVLGENFCSYSNVDEKGKLEAPQTPCYKLWNRTSRCRNCTSRRALRYKKTEHKIEIFNDEAYIVYSVYIELEGKPVVIELLSSVGADMITGLPENVTLLEMIQTGHKKIYEDPLLEIYNRRFYVEQTPEMEGITAVAMFDLDRFKLVNDAYGRSSGDIMLKAIVENVKGCIRKTDIMIRYGGDEFLIIFIGLEGNYLKEKLETIRQAIEQTRVSQLPEARVTASIGGCCIDKMSSRVVDYVDKAMYEGKQVRNTVVIKEYTDEF